MIPLLLALLALPCPTPTEPYLLAPVIRGDAPRGYWSGTRIWIGDGDAWRLVVDLPCYNRRYPWLCGADGDAGPCEAIRVCPGVSHGIPLTRYLDEPAGRERYFGITVYGPDGESPMSDPLLVCWPEVLTLP